MTFYWTPTTLIISLLVLGVTVACCLLSWQRSGYARSMGLLEILRFVLVLMAVITLNQPEMEQEVLPDEQPTVVVLYDTSESMQTQDVLDPDQSARAPLTRAQATEKVIDAKIWEPLKEQMEVIFEPFSSDLTNADQASDLNAALQKAYEQHTNLQGIVLVSDGDWNIGKPPSAAATTLRMKQVPVFSVPAGSEERLPDVELASTDAPTFGVVGKSLSIPFHILSWLPKDKDVKVTLTGTRGENIEKTIQVAGMGQARESLNWKPEKEGDYDLTLEIPVDPDEINQENNKLTFPVSIKKETLKVLLIESYPRWEYRYLRNALERDPGAEVNCLLFHPTLKEVGGGRGYLEEFPEDKDLFKYDVVFLGDVGLDADQLSLTNCESLRQLVRSHAGGLVFMPGFRGRQQSLLTTELGDLLPVIMDGTTPRGYGLPRPARFTLTESGRRSLLTRLETVESDNERVWKSLPGFQWYAAALRAKVGSTVLATHDSESTRFGRVPLIVTRTSGTGKVLFMGTDGAWRWRRGVEDLYHYRFWSQFVRWMAYQRNMSTGEMMRLFYSPDRPEANNVLTLNANVMSATGEPLRVGTVAVQVTSPSGRVDTITLAPAGEDSWGLFTGEFTPKEGGEYKLLTSCAETGAKLETTIAVQGQERERVGQPARYDVLKEIATITRGDMASLGDISELVTKIAQQPEPEPLIKRFRIWSHPLWGGLILLLLAIFWSGRKLAGLA